MSHPTLSDKDYEEIERLVNRSIHELVFTLKHADDDQVEDANQCLLTAVMNMERVNAILAAAEKAREEAT